MEPFDLVAFVTRSENRLAALRALAAAARTRADLQAETGAPRSTLSRVLADLREHDLVTRDGGTYRTTPLGDRLAAGLDSLFDDLEAARALQAVARWLPLDLADVADVAVTLPAPTDPMAPVKRAAAAIDDVEHVRGFCYSVVHAPILAECRNVVERGHRFEGVIAAGVLDVVADDPDLAGRLRELLAEGDAELYLHEGDVEPQLIIADRTTIFLVTDGAGAIQGLVEIGDGAIHPWAEETFESIKHDAEPLDPAAVAERLTS